ncbi:DUF4153 domain-containing protein [Flammeovirga pacifica]|uniref:DUF4153 domain-containing protein n=1 Tax=Flammeovirga pacifica TaxID=915059 RepID=A0A1S1Z2Y8_FLAPC|nr:DUF4153 domain-containing protein [Flammeovirga pacifica]OHX67639.1 hypothetical protein NH26_15405 [Flammeovirga pacifica]
MKSLSIQQLIDGLYKSVSRFPLAILSAILLNFLIIYGIETDIDPSIWYYRSIHGAQLGVPLFIALTLFSESKNFNAIKGTTIKFIGVVLLVIYLFTLPETLTFINFSRWILLSILVLLLVFIAPSLHKGHELHFWVLSKETILIAIECLFYGLVIGLGLFVAISAIHFLFDIHISSNRYPEVMSICLITLSTLFFGGKMPAVAPSQTDVFDYPSILKNFTQFILIPLVLLYLIILYVYGAQIIINQNWPKGYVSYLSIGFSILGLMTIILIYPIRNDINNKWIPLYNKVFLYTLFPIIFLFCAAIWRRISEYGITENRYYLIALGLWLTFISVYTLIKRDKFIKMIPISLAVLCVLVAFGPFSAFNVSKKSQFNRLKLIGEKNHWIDENGHWVNGIEKDVPIKDINESVSIVKYLIKNHGYETLQPLFKDSVSYYVKNIDGKYAQSRVFLGKMNLSKIHHDESQRFNLKNQHYSDLEISGYNYYFTQDLPYGRITNQSNLQISKEKDIQLIINNEDESLLGELIIGEKKYTIPFPLEEEMNYKHKDFLISFDFIDYTKKGNQPIQINNMKFNLFIK